MHLVPGAEVGRPRGARARFAFWISEIHVMALRDIAHATGSKPNDVLEDLIQQRWDTMA